MAEAIDWLGAVRGSRRRLLVSAPRQSTTPRSRGRVSAAIASPATEQMVVPIVGMGRSGTSMAGRVLQDIGVPLGHDFMRAGHDNPAGFWEHRRIVLLHQLILTHLDSSFHSTYALPEGWLERQFLNRIRISLSDLVKRELSDGDSWAFKDPRTARLLPLWHQILDDLGLKRGFVLPFRHPVAVAESLAARDGISLDHGYLMWLQYNLDAVRHTDAHPRVFIEYDHFLDDPVAQTERIVDTLRLPVSLNSEQRAEAVRAAVDPRMRHHHHDDAKLAGGGGLLALVRETYELLAAAGEGYSVGEPLLKLANRFLLLQTGLRRPQLAISR